MKIKNNRNEIIDEVIKVREELLKKAKGNPSIINKHGLKIAKELGLKLSKRPAAKMLRIAE